MNTRPTRGASIGGLTSAGEGSSSTSSVEQRPHSVLKLAAPAEERHDLSRQHRLLHGGNHLLAGEGVPGEVLLQQGIVGGGHRLGHLLLIPGERVLVLGRNRGLLVLARLGTGLEELTGLGEQVDDPAELGPVAHRDLDREDFGVKSLLDVLERLLEVGVILVHPGDEEDPG